MPATKPPAKKPVKAAPTAVPVAAPGAKPAPRAHGPVVRALVRAGKDLGPYVLALGVFAIAAKYTLNTTAARYADDLFTLALIMIKAGGHLPPPAAKP